jgi:hypothetical protein
MFRHRRNKKFNIFMKTNPRPHPQDQDTNWQWGDEREVKAAVMPVPIPPIAIPPRPLMRDAFGQSMTTVSISPDSNSNNDNTGGNMESECNCNASPSSAKKRRGRKSDSSSNSNSTNTSMIHPPVWANSNTLMELPKIECPIQRVDESERKAIALATKLSLQSEKERQYNISRLQYNELQRTILQSRRELLLQRNQDEGDDIVEIVSQLSILSEEQRKLNCELYNLEMELDLDRSHHF